MQTHIIALIYSCRAHKLRPRFQCNFIAGRFLCGCRELTNSVHSLLKVLEGLAIFIINVNEQLGTVPKAKIRSRKFDLRRMSGMKVA